MKLLHYSADQRTIVFVLFTIVYLVVPLFVVLPFWVAIIWFFGAIVFSFAACVINHNQQHCPIFYSKPLNNVFNILLTIAKGHTALTVVVPHNMNHHKHGCSDDDWIRMKHAGSGPGIMRLLRYVFFSSRTMRSKRKLANAPKLSPSQIRQQRFERVALLVFCLAAMLINYEAFIVLIGMPWVTAMLLLVAVNLPQHDGCDHESKYNHSRNFSSPIFNWLFFNNGYHTMHHMKPSLHWSLLPEAHSKDVAPYMQEDLMQESLLRFVLHEYILNFKGSTLCKVKSV